MSARILEGPKCEYSVQEKNLGYFFFNCCSKYDERICQIDGTSNKTETYGSVKIRSVRLAIQLRQTGVTSDDVIAICSENTLDTIIPLVAGFFIGAKVANFDPSLSLRHTKHLLSIVQPKVVFVQEACLKLFEESLSDANFSTDIVVFGNSKKYKTFSDFQKPQENENKFLPSDVDSTKVAFMLFSSGSTGFPKAICHSHRSYFHTIAQICHIKMSENILHFTTLYWVTAMAMLGGSINVGSYRVFCRNPSSEDIFRIIERYKVKCTFLSPAIAYKLTVSGNTRNYDTSSLKMMICGGASIATSQLQKLSKLFSNAQVTLGFGMTEISVISIFYPEEDKEFIRRKLSSCGKPGPDVQIKVVDPITEDLLGPNVRGELCIKSPAIMVGYYKMDSSGVFYKNGFLKTGDEGYYDDDDCVYVLERYKEMFKYSGGHITPSVIEAALLEHPAISEAVVFGYPQEGDEVPAACIVLKQNCKLDKNEIDNFLKERVADRERLRGGVTFVESLPQTATGKMNRREIRDFVISLKN